MREPLPDWTQENAMQVLEEYLTLARSGDERGMAFVDSPLMDWFCSIVDADADNFRKRLEDKQMALLDKREREPQSFTQPIYGIPYKQYCENCQAPFYYHYQVHYCPLCEDAILGDEKIERKDYRDKEIMDIENERSKNYEVNHNLGAFYRYTVEYDPLPVDCGGFSKGARMNLEEVEAGLRMHSLSPGMIIKYSGKRDRIYKVIFDECYKLMEIRMEEMTKEIK